MDFFWWLGLIILICLLNLVNAAPHISNKPTHLTDEPAQADQSTHPAHNATVHDHETPPSPSPPSPTASKPSSIKYDVGTHLQALSLYKAGIPFKNIFKITNITLSSIYHL